MAFAYTVGAGGLGLAFPTVFDPQPDLRWATLLAVGLAGIISFVRHSSLNRGDAARMGWDTGTTTPFQIEAGPANMAAAVPATIAVIFNWDLPVYSATFLVFGCYMVAVTGFNLTLASRGARDEWVASFFAVIFGVLLAIVGVAGMQEATSPAAKIHIWLQTPTAVVADCPQDHPWGAGALVHPVSPRDSGWACRWCWWRCPSSCWVRPTPDMA